MFLDGDFSSLSLRRAHLRDMLTVLSTAMGVSRLLTPLGVIPWRSRRLMYIFLWYFLHYSSGGFVYEGTPFFPCELLLF